MSDTNIAFILYSSITILTLIIFMFFLYQYSILKKNELIKYKQRVKEETDKSYLEMQEEIFQQISWELHDNIGQLLTVAKMKLGSSNLAEDPEMVEDLDDLLAKSIQEVRNISKMLNKENFDNLGLVNALVLEIERLKKLKLKDAQLSIEGSSAEWNREHEVIIFRIIQEFISNSIKHSKSERLFVQLKFFSNYLSIILMDFGVGFDINKIQRGSGLLHVEQRAKLIKADYSLHSDEGKGTILTLKIPYNE